MMALGQYVAILVDTWWYWISREQQQLIHDGTWSLQGGTGWNLVVLGQQKAVLGQYKAVRAESIWMSGGKGLKEGSFEVFEHGDNQLINRTTNNRLILVHV